MVMATHGHPEPNFDKIKIGATRQVIEHEFGTPIASHRLEDGTQQDTYKYEMGNSPNPGRASVYLYACLTIIGILGEPIYSLIELMQGYDEETKVIYGPDNRALTIVEFTSMVDRPRSAYEVVTTASVPSSFPIFMTVPSSKFPE